MILSSKTVWLSVRGRTSYIIIFVVVVFVVVGGGGVGSGGGSFPNNGR